MTRWMRWLPIWIGLWCALSFVPAWASDAGLHPVPALTARVMDETGTLSATDLQQLESQLAGLETTRGSQVVVLMVSTTQPEDIAAFAQRVGDSWKIGRKDVGDGLLIVVAKEDRRMRIEVAKALEGAIPDLAAKQVIERSLKPAFRAGDYAGGLRQAISQLDALIQGEHLPPPDTTPPNAQPVSGVDLMVLLIVLALFGTVICSVMSLLFAKLLGPQPTSLLSGGVMSGLGWLFTTSVVGSAALFVLGWWLSRFFVNHLPQPSSQVSTHGTRSPAITTWTNVGSSHDSGFSFSSGGGGDFGGGGASDSW